MQGKNIVVIGAAGGVGEGIADEFLRAGANVIATARSQDRLEALSSRLGNSAALALAAGNLSSEQAAAELAGAVAAISPRIDGVIASLGSWWQGPPLVEMPLADWNSVFADRLTTHFLAAKHFIPLIAKTSPSGFYFLIGGASAEMPIANSGPISIAGAAQVMFTKVLRAEAKQQPIRIQELMIWSTIATRVHGGKVDPSWITPNEVGRHLIALAGDPASAKDAVIHLRSRAQVRIV